MVTIGRNTTMENKKNELGNIYSARVSKNGNWLNLTIVTHIDGNEFFITCPVRLRNTIEGKPYANVQDDKATIHDVKVYDDVKQEAPVLDDLPF